MAKPVAPAVSNTVVEDLPVVEWVTMQRTPKGWIVLLCKTRGDKVLEREVVKEPQAKAYACEDLKITVVNRFIREQPNPNRGS